VLRFERDWLRALVERDRATLDRILADDFIDSNWKGELRNKSQVLAGLSKLVPCLQRLQDVKIKLYQDVVVARGLNIISDQTGRSCCEFDLPMSCFTARGIGERSPHKKKR